MFPDVLPPLIDHLAGVTGVTTASRVPDPRPGELVQVRRVGGTAAPPVQDQPRVDVLCWAATDQRAMEIGLQVRTAVWALAGTALGAVRVHRVGEFLGPRLDDDPITGTTGTSRRCWATYDISIRADAAIWHAAP